MSDNNDNKPLLVIKASAGSGKTYRLALEYIKHLLFTDDGGKLLPRRAAGDTRLLNAHRQLLAITFTNKATDEMKERIVAELYNLSQPGWDSDYLAGFMQHSGLDEASVRDLARQALDELLFDYSNFNVSTIDSFFQTILRNFARELDRDFNYDIQLDEDYAVRVAVHNFLLSLGREGHDSQVDRWVKEYQQHLIRSDAKSKNWKFFDDSGDLNRFARQINSELFRSRLDAICKYLGTFDDDGNFKADFSKIRAFKKFIHDDALPAAESNVQQLLMQLRATLDPFAAQLKYTIKNWYEKASGQDELEPLPDRFSDADEEKMFTQFKAGVPEATVLAVYDLVKRHYAMGSVVDFLKHIENNLGLLGMLAMIDLFLQAFRHETNTILIGDTNELIGAVLKSGCDFIYERVGTTISNFMIDEFQDTSAKQFENFSGLLHESLASDNFNMLIGDAKQSIYRFRNADPTVFREKVETEFNGKICYGGSEEGQSAADGFTSTNYRSSRHIIEFNNSLFTYIRGRFSDRPTVVTTYADVKQKMPDDIDTDKVGGYVRLMTDNYRQLLANEVIRQALPPGVDPDGDTALTALDVLPGYLLWLHERYDWKRIGILVNKNKEGDAVVEAILNYNKRATGEKIRIISGESLLLNNSPIIRRIIAMLRFIDISQFGSADEEDDETRDDAGEATPVDDVRRRILKKRESDRRLYTALNTFIKAVAAHPDAAPLDNGKLLAESLQQQPASADEALQPQDDMLDKLLPPAGELTTLVSIVETIIHHFKQDDKGRGDVDRETAFLLAFQDTVMQFSSMRNGGSVREFLKYWDEKKGSLAVSSSSRDNAIEIMSIHKAKGLEFDCVVIPFADWELDSNSRETSYWMPGEDFHQSLSSLPISGQTCDPSIVPPLLHVNKKASIALNKAGMLGTWASDFVTKQVDDVLIDNLNKTYVAMTRPRSELHIFAKGKVDTVSAMLADYASQSEIMTPVVGASAWYELGTPPTVEEFEVLRQKKERKRAASNNREREVDRIDITGYTVNDLPLELEVRVENAPTSKRKAGLRLHGLLSRIHDRNDVQSVIDFGIKHGVITDDPDDLCNLDNVRARLCAPILADDGPVAAWFDPANRVYSERTITTGTEKTEETENTAETADDGIENLRPDRIIRRPDGQILVIDYKSGMRNDSKYCRQVQQYIDKLRLIFPDAPIAGRIWYITHGLILDETGHPLTH